MNAGDMNEQSLRRETRRHFFRDCGLGIGKIACASLLAGDMGQAAETDVVNPTAARKPHFPARAKRVIYLFMAGAPSQLELFDHKPKLAELEGKPIPPSVVKGQRYAFIQPDAAVLGPRFRFGKHGKSGAEISEMLPHLSKVVDEIAMVRSVHTDLFNHSPCTAVREYGQWDSGTTQHGVLAQLWDWQRGP